VSIVVPSVRHNHSKMVEDMGRMFCMAPNWPLPSSLCACLCVVELMWIEACFDPQADLSAM